VVVGKLFTVMQIKFCHQINNKKHLKNVGPIRHNEPPHANSPGVATVLSHAACRIDVHNDDNDDDDDNNDNA